MKSYVGFDREPRIEGHVVFKNPVPMQFAWNRLKERVALHIMSDLHMI